MSEEGCHIPIATYRLQFGADFTFDHAAAVVGYLHRLGISHCYASPYLKARAGSPHGYDIVDHNALNPEVGDRASLGRFVRALHHHRMGQILDIVPNHMGVGGDDNAWWLDMLENGQASPWASFFDIDWNPVKEELRGKVLIPVLGDHYGSVLEAGQLRLVFDEYSGAFSLYYYEHRFPVDPRTYPVILEDGLADLERRLGSDAPAFVELQSLITAFTHLPSRFEVTADSIQERLRDKEIHKRHLAELVRQSPALGESLRDSIQRFNGSEGDPRSFDRLHALLERQCYRLAYWQVASDEINYRRFFDINDLAGLRMEEPAVFDATHGLILELVADGSLCGLRVDHPDGLYDPLSYCRRLQQEVQRRLPAACRPRSPGHNPVDAFYLVVEKILASHERLDESWPVHGTTGYGFANTVNGLFVDPEAEAELTRIYGRFIGQRLDFEDLLFARKRHTIKVQLSSELTVLANMLDDLAQGNRRTRDFTLNGCREALINTVACFPVYRTYITENSVSDEDRRYVDWAIAQAKKRSPAADVSIFDFVREVLLEGPLSAKDDYRARATRFVMRFQQYTAPVMAKALEDNVFYIYNRLIALNEVGGDPRRFATTVSAFHHANQERLRNWPHGMLATSTHDTKRSEDVRARIDVLSEMPAVWRKHLGRWSRVNRSKRRIVDGQSAPSRNDEYLLYQTLVGMWPLRPMEEARYGEFEQRIKAYMLKAVKEAKVITSWINPNLDYEAAVEQFVEALLNPSGQNPFLADFIPFAEVVARFGLLNSLAQTALKLASPGVPDLYQGTELWDFSLVDPDNRRPVDYPRRERMLAELQRRAAHEPLSGLAHELASQLPDGRAKLYLIWRVLELRGQRADLFAHGDYLPAAGEGRWGEHLCAFARRFQGQTVVCVVPRLLVKLGADTVGYPFAPGLWKNTVVILPEAVRRLRNVLTDQWIEPQARAGTYQLEAEELFQYFPVALLADEA